MYRLLIVDDEEDIRNGMSRGIPWKEWGFTVVGIAENGEEAVFLRKRKNRMWFYRIFGCPKWMALN